MAGQIPAKPKRTIRDEARWVSDMAIAGLPRVGGPLRIFLNRVLQPNIDKRTEAWLEQLAHYVQELIDQVGDLDESKLAENDLFVSGVIQASGIAQGTAQVDKIRMLHSAVMNIACGQYSDDFLTHRFLSFIEELTPEHFAVLSYSTKPRAWHPNRDSREHATPLGLLDQARFDFDRNLIPLLLADLAAKSLVNLDVMEIVANGDQLMQPFSTNLGLELIKFVYNSSTPDPDAFTVPNGEG